MDVTGNTHRAEFCIDKLYCPDTAERPPRAGRAAGVRDAAARPDELVQQLLLRSLVARFWKKPYDQKLVRWGTELHDRFMLPHFVERGLRRRARRDSRARPATPFDPAWFAPHLEFRFPLLGHGRRTAACNLELRQAIEPWHVLGEESAAGGHGPLRRFVASSGCR